MAGELERAQKALHDLGKSIESLHGDPSPKSVHKLRTALRRVEAIAAVLDPADGKQSRHLAKSIEPVRKAAGQVRDIDVLMANARKLARYGASESLTHLLASLKAARQENAAQLARAMRHRRNDVERDLKEFSRSVRAALRPAESTSSSGAESGQTQEEIHSAAVNLVRELGGWPRLDEHNLHAFRLKVKQLRYTLHLDENANAALVKALGDVQRRIGDWHDWRQLEEIARGLLTHEKEHALLNRIAATVRRRFNRALAAANALRGKYLAAPQTMGA
ncbi:MAG: CHAD domain-containing protein [Terracidiphilus sp.]